MNLAGLLGGLGAGLTPTDDGPSIFDLGPPDRFIDLPRLGDFFNLPRIGDRFPPLVAEAIGPEAMDEETRRRADEYELHRRMLEGLEQRLFGPPGGRMNPLIKDAPDLLEPFRKRYNFFLTG